MDASRTRHLAQLATLLLAALAVSSCGQDVPATGQAPLAAESVSRLPRTDVALTTQAPIGEGRNVLWCASFQLAWDALADTVGRDGRLELGPPAPPAAVAELNRHSFPRGDLDAASCVVLGGLGRDGIVEKISAAVRERFGPDVTGPTIEAGPIDAIGYAMLRKDLLFETPFRVHPTPMSFAGGPARVHSFGMLHDDRSESGNAMAKQVTRYFAFDGKIRLVPGNADVIELLPKGGEDRIVLSQGAGKATLEEAWAATAEQMARGRPKPYEHADQLEIPAIDLRISHQFTELLGARLAGVPDSKMKDAQQRVSFSLSERGAVAASDALIEATMGSGGEVSFSGPFLLALIRRGATRPYLLLWIVNDDFLVKDGGEFRMPPAMVGEWTLDRERTVAANLAQWDADERRQDDDAKRAGTVRPTRRDETPEQRRAREESLIRAGMADTELSLEMRADGTWEMTGMFAAFNVIKALGAAVTPKDLERVRKQREGARTIRITGGSFARDGKTHLAPSTVDDGSRPHGGQDFLAVEGEDGAIRLITGDHVNFVLRKK